MKIDKITASGLQGQQFTLPLTAVTAIVGPNARGKTTRLNAITLTLAGYVPGVAKKSNEVYERLATDNPMRVTGQAGAEVIDRVWREKRGSVSAEFSPAAKGLEIPPVAIDPDEFFAMSGPDRTRFLFSAVDSPDLRIEFVAALVTSNLKNIKLEGGNTPASETAITSLCAFVMQSAIGQVQEFLAHVGTSFREKRLLADQSVKRLEGTLAGLTQTAESSAVPSDAEARLSKARQDLEAINIAVGKLDQSRRQLEADVAQARELSTSAVDEAEALRDIEDLEAQRATELAVPPAPGDEAMPSAATPEQARKIAELIDEKERLFKLFSIMQRPAAAVEEARQKLEEAKAEQRRRHDAVRAALAEVERLTDLKAKAEHLKTCPTCGQSVEAHQRAVADGYESQLQAAKTSLLSAQASSSGFTADKELAAVTAAQSDLNAWDEAKARYQAASVEHSNLVAEVQQATRRAWSKLNDDHVQAQHRARRIADDIARLRARIGNKAAADAAASLPRLERELEDAKASYASACQDSIARKQVVTATEDDVRRLTQTRADGASRARAAEMLGEAKGEQAVVRLACDMMVELQEKILEKAAAPLLARCNELCAGILDAPLAWRDGELGITRARFISLRTMSGAERALARMSVSLALAERSPIKFAILDEAGRLDQANKLRLVRNLLAMTRAGRISQAVIVDTSPADYLSVADPDFSIVTV